jgi:cytochrome c biogenesis factor
MTFVRPDLDLIEAPPTPTTHEIDLKQENTRKLLAIILLLILAAEVAAALIWVFWAFYFTAKDGKDISPLMKDILSIIFGPTIALVGAATGFYFGSNAGNKTP